MYKCAVGRELRDLGNGVWQYCQLPQGHKGEHDFNDKPRKSLAQLQDEIAAWGAEKGWSFKQEEIPEKLMLVCCEIAEAMEHYRHGKMELFYDDNGKPDGFPIELADAVIRILHLCDPNIDIEEAIRIKMEYNHTRPYRHGDLKA